MRRRRQHWRLAIAPFYSDGLVEAHGPQGEMFGVPHLRRLLAEHDAEERSLAGFLMDKLRSFTGYGWEQEDDITLVTLQRSAHSKRPPSP
jgi:serine phosphatase RsbU (regulator of sigma subunit)